MKKLLLCAIAGLVAAVAHAQAVVPVFPDPRLALPGDLGSEPGNQAAPAWRGAIVRKPRRAINYAWDTGGGRWSAAGTVSTYTYDGNGNTTQLLATDSASQRPVARFSYTYNAAGKQTGSVQESWSGSAWQNSSRTIMTYNSRNLSTGYVSQGWVNGEWQDNFRSVLEYDSHDHVVVSESQILLNNVWTISSGVRTAVTYTPAGAVLEETEQRWDATARAYVPSTRRQYSYPSAMALEYSAHIMQTWSNGAYVNQQRNYNVVRDAQGRQTYYDIDSWTGTGTWQLARRFTTVYQPNGSYQTLLDLRQQDTWRSLNRSTRIYDDFGNELSYSSEVWNGTAWTTTEGFQLAVRYNATNDAVRAVRQAYDTMSRFYRYTSKTLYSDFETITLGVDPNVALAAQTQLYPNPTTGRTTLALTGLDEQVPVQAEVVNSLGQVVQCLVLPVRQGRVQQTLELSQQPAGVYSVHLHTRGGLVVKKVVRQ